jgi:hypothetical protein
MRDSWPNRVGASGKEESIIESCADHLAEIYRQFPKAFEVAHATHRSTQRPAARPHRAPPRLPAANGVGETSLMTTETTHPRLVGVAEGARICRAPVAQWPDNLRAPVTPARPGAVRPHPSVKMQVSLGRAGGRFRSGPVNRLMPRLGNDSMYLLRDWGRRGQFRPFSGSCAEMLAMAAPDDSRLSQLASRTGHRPTRDMARDIRPMVGNLISRKGNHPVRFSQQG